MEDLEKQIMNEPIKSMYIDIIHKNHETIRNLMNRINILYQNHQNFEQKTLNLEKRITTLQGNQKTFPSQKIIRFQQPIKNNQSKFRHQLTTNNDENNNKVQTELSDKNSKNDHISIKKQPIQKKNLFKLDNITSQLQSQPILFKNFRIFENQYQRNGKKSKKYTLLIPNAKTCQNIQSQEFLKSQRVLLSIESIQKQKLEQIFQSDELILKTIQTKIQNIKNQLRKDFQCFQKRLKIFQQEFSSLKVLQYDKSIKQLNICELQKNSEQLKQKVFRLQNKMLINDLRFLDIENLINSQIKDKFFSIQMKIAQRKRKSSQKFLTKIFNQRSISNIFDQKQQNKQQNNNKLINQSHLTQVENLLEVAINRNRSKSKFSNQSNGKKDSKFLFEKVSFRTPPSHSNSVRQWQRNSKNLSQHFATNKDKQNKIIRCSKLKKIIQ